MIVESCLSEQLVIIVIDNSYNHYKILNPWRSLEHTCEQMFESMRAKPKDKRQTPDQNTMIPHYGHLNIVTFYFGRMASFLFDDVLWKVNQEAVMLSYTINK